MGIGLGGSSEAYPPLDDGTLLNTALIVTAHDSKLFATDTAPGNHNLLIGRNVVSKPAAANNTVIGENVIVSTGVQNTTSLGRSGVVLSESDMFYLGDFLKYRASRGQLGQLEIMNGLVQANSQTREVALGPNSDLRVDDHGTSVATPLQIRSRDVSVQEWEIAVEPSEEDPVSRDLVLRAADGTSVVFCSGAAQTIA
jgi:hypothetical protein